MAVALVAVGGVIVLENGGTIAPGEGRRVLVVVLFAVLLPLCLVTYRWFCGYVLRDEGRPS